MGSDVENLSFDELQPEISWDKGVPGAQTGGTPPEAFWRPLGTWRKVLRTIFESADLGSWRVRLLLPKGFTLLKWFPLRADQTYFVSLDKTNCLSVEMR